MWQPNPLVSYALSSVSKWAPRRLVAWSQPAAHSHAPLEWAFVPQPRPNCPPPRMISCVSPVSALATVIPQSLWEMHPRLTPLPGFPFPPFPALPQAALRSPPPPHSGLWTIVFCFKSLLVRTFCAWCLPTVLALHFYLGSILAVTGV